MTTQATMNDETLKSVQPNRREFVGAGLGLSAAGLLAAGAGGTLLSVENALAATAGEPSKPLLRSGDTILFQGDSITDAGRKRERDEANDAAALGLGYAWLASAQLLINSPEANYKIFNRGISGNKVYQLAERWEKDCLELKPDVLSILIGVNDFWHIRKNGYDGTLEKYESGYRELLERTRKALPNVRLVICEPFLLVAGKDVKESWLEEFSGYCTAARRVAEGVGAVFVPFHSIFVEACKVAPPETWAGDGVHPSASGATIMASAWLKAVGA